MIGNQRYAELAATFRHWDAETNALPDGWEFLGQGCYRTAWRGPDGYVYKVQHDTDQHVWQYTENFLEYKNFLRLGDLIMSESSGKVRLARANYFPSVNVICMEYVPKSRAAMWYGPNDEKFFPVPVDEATKELVNLLRRHNLSDTNACNVWYDETDTLVMVDYVG